MADCFAVGRLVSLTNTSATHPKGNAQLFIENTVHRLVGYFRMVNQAVAQRLDSNGFAQFFGLRRSAL